MSGGAHAETLAGMLSASTGLVGPSSSSVGAFAAAMQRQQLIRQSFAAFTGA